MHKRNQFNGKNVTFMWYSNDMFRYMFKAGFVKPVKVKSPVGSHHLILWCPDRNNTEKLAMQVFFFFFFFWEMQECQNTIFFFAGGLERGFGTKVSLPSALGMPT